MDCRTDMLNKNKGPYTSTGSVCYYEENAYELFSRYESISFDEIHAGVLDLIPTTGTALDIGAGSGRDAAALALRGFQVTAVEPSQSLLEMARRSHRDLNIAWTCDHLPHLSSLADTLTFDLVLLAAVWMHVPPAVESGAITRIAELTRHNGLVVLSLRNPVPKVSGTVEKTAEQVIARFSQGGFNLVRKCHSGDLFDRAGIEWTELAFKPK